METRISSGVWHEAEADWLVVGVGEAGDVTGRLAALDAATGGLFGRLRESGDLTGKLAELLAVHDVPGIPAKRMLFVGLGNTDALTPARIDKVMMTAVRHISSKDQINVAIALPDSLPDRLSVARCVQCVATAVMVAGNGQDLYRSEPGRFPIDRAQILVDRDSDTDSLDDAMDRGLILGEAINLTRELVNRPAQEIFPASVAERAEAIASQYGMTCHVLDETRLREENMGSLLAVAIGSDQPPRVVVLEYRGAGEQAATLGLVGKGVTFDSGGLSLKSTDGMKTMKSDMAGAATVMGAMAAIARLQLPVNVTGYLGLVENMVSGKSYKLGDVLVARNEVTIEVLNTDAEGRLVLADVLSYAVDHGAKKLIDLATLTGACVVALGEDVTGAFANDDHWCSDVLAAAGRVGEEVWQMPMFDHYSELLKSDVADIKNVAGRWGGAITAAKFLENFVGETPWVHLDIAGPSFASSNKPHREGGGTGCLVRTLVEVASTLSSKN